ncbi:MAG: serine hydrolase [Candidatus Aegiribacteria sp.]|nr:serine hydrolase [Candidatus Aegiribacteria sp.]
MRIFKPGSIFISVAVLLITANGICLADPPDAYILEIMAQYHYPGCAAVAASGDSIIWSGAFGDANFNQGTIVTDSTLFYLYSPSKTVTGVVFMQLWEDGLVGLDDDISDYLPCTIENPFYPGVTITPRMILTHTSALDDNPALNDELIALGDSTYSNIEFCQEFFVPGGSLYSTDNFQNFEPGSDYDYSTISFTVLAAITESVSPYSDSFDLHCREYLFEPLLMDNTSFIISSIDTTQLAMPYSWNGSTHVPYGYRTTPHYPGAWLKTSALQLKNYLIAFMQGGEIGGVRILESTTVDSMLTIQYPGIDPHQGLAWYRTYHGGREIWGHSGGGFGYGGSSEMFYCPAENSSVIVLTNGESGATSLIMDSLFNYVSAELSIETGDGVLSCVALSRICPNPFTGSTAISFELPASAQIHLDVYDICGRKVRSLVEGGYPAGTTSVDFQQGELSSGLYFIVLRSGSDIRTERCVLLKQ